MFDTRTSAKNCSASAAAASHCATARLLTSSVVFCRSVSSCSPAFLSVQSPTLALVAAEPSLAVPPTSPVRLVEPSISALARVSAKVLPSLPRGGEDVVTVAGSPVVAARTDVAAGPPARCSATVLQPSSHRDDATHRGLSCSSSGSGSVLGSRSGSGSGSGSESARCGASSSFSAMLLEREGASRGAARQTSQTRTGWEMSSAGTGASCELWSWQVVRPQLRQW